MRVETSMAEVIFYSHGRFLHSAMLDIASVEKTKLSTLRPRMTAWAKAHPARLVPFIR